MNTELLNPEYTFQNFIIGSNNKLAHAGATAVAQTPAAGSNPLFIWGDTGLGKTHLVQAIGHQMISVNSNLKVLYVSTEQFHNEFIQSVMTNKMSSFKMKYSEIDVLLIIDIQFLEKKVETRNEFFNIFNKLCENKKQIVISCDRPPDKLSALTERLKVRFELSSIVHILPPDFETRRNISINLAERKKLNLSDEIINLLSGELLRPRAIENAIYRINLLTEKNKNITKNLVNNFIIDLF